MNIIGNDLNKSWSLLLRDANFPKCSCSGYFWSDTNAVFALLWLTYPVVPKSLKWKYVRFSSVINDKVLDEMKFIESSDHFSSTCHIQSSAFSFEKSIKSFPPRSPFPQWNYSSFRRHDLTTGNDIYRQIIATLRQIFYR